MKQTNSSHWRSHAGTALVLAATLVLAACNGGSTDAPGATPTPEPEADLSVVVDGQVVPLRSAALALEVSGVVQEVLAAEGQRVSAGDPLARLGNRQAMQAAVDTARVEQLMARQAYDELLERAPSVTAQAQLALANARDALKDAEYRWRVQQEGYRASADTIRLARANLAVAEDAVDDAEDAYHMVSGRDADDRSRAMALANLVEAKKRRDDLKRSYNWYTGRPSEVDQAILDAELARAQADLQAAQIEWEKVEAGVDEQDLSLAHARLAQSTSGLAAAEEALAQMELRAPFDGVLLHIDLRPGEYASAGIPVAWLADDAGWQVETTNLGEVDVARVRPGDPARVSLDAIPEVEMEGIVESVQGYGESRQGDITYTAIIRLPSPDPRLRWNMTAFVTIEPLSQAAQAPAALRFAGR